MRDYELADIEKQGLAVRHVLGRDGGRIAEGLAAVPRRTGRIAGEVLIINQPAT